MMGAKMRRIHAKRWPRRGGKLIRQPSEDEDTSRRLVSGGQASEAAGTGAVAATPRDVPGRSLITTGCGRAPVGLRSAPLAVGA